MPSFSKNRDNAEVQDLYRRTLAASWSRQPAQLPADECIEDIFSGGDGWKPASTGSSRREPSSSNTDPEEADNDLANNGTLRPSDFRRLGLSHRRNHSASSEKSVSTVTGHHHNSPSPRKPSGRMSRRDSRTGEDHAGRSSSRSGSIASLAPTLGSSSGNERNADPSYRNQREVDEADVRDDLVAWQLPGQQGVVT